mgnify:CR=1 FL=1
MKIAEYSVKHPQITILVIIFIAIISISTLFNIPKSEDPEILSPVFPVIVIYPGTSPKDLEEMVVNPIERKMSSLEGIKKITSDISDGVAVVNVEYKYGSDVDAKYQEVVREINGMRGELPQNIYKIDIQKWMPSNVNILQTALISENAPYSKMKEYSEKLRDELEKIPALKDVKIYGLPDKTVRVELQLEKMNQLHIPLDAVLGSIQSESANIPGGSVDADKKTFNIQTSGTYKNIEQIKNTIVYSAEGRIIYLKDIATVYEDFEKNKHITRLNSSRCVTITAAQKPGENISNTEKAFLPVLQKFKQTLPGNIVMVNHFNQAANVNKRMLGLGTDFLIAIGLVLLTLLPLGNRAALIVMISIPLSLGLGIVTIDYLGFNLNQLSIVGLVIALGLLVDDSIVVVENIERWLREGYTIFEATIKGTKQIALAVMGCTATLIVAFLPLTFLPDSSGDFIRSVPAAVIACVLASMLVSLTIIPFFANRLLKEHAGHPDGNMFLRALKKVINMSYTKLFGVAINHPVYTLLITFILFLGSLGLFKIVGFSLFPPSEKPQFLIDITTPLQSNLNYTDSVSRNIENELKKHKEVKYYATNVGEGNPQIYYNVTPENERSDYAEIFVQLDEHTKPDDKLALIEELRKKWTPYLGAKIEVKNFEQGPPVLAPVEVRLTGDNIDTLREISLKIENMMKSCKGSIYVNNPLANLKSDIKVDINKDKANMLGVPTINIDKTVRMAVTGLNAGEITDEKGNSHNIVVTRAKDDMNSLDAFKNLFVTNIQGTAIPLSQIAAFKFEASPVVISHNNKVRSVSITSFVQKGMLNEELIKSVEDKLKEMKFPEGYSYTMGGEVEQRSDSFSGLSVIILLTAFLFLLILLLEFRTFKSALIVLSVIPLGIIGAAAALLVTGNSLSFVAVVGLIALAGIEVKNTILIVDFTNQLREQGKSLNEAIREAGEVRILPILLTSMTAIGGLFPIAISTNPLISPLAIVLIGGLISSTLLSAIIAPVMYKLIPPEISK